MVVCGFAQGTMHLFFRGKGGFRVHALELTADVTNGTCLVAECSSYAQLYSCSVQACLLS